MKLILQKIKIILESLKKNNSKIVIIFNGVDPLYDEKRLNEDLGTKAFANKIN